MVVCVYLPRFELVVAAGGPRALAGRPLAVAPLTGAGRSASGPGGRVGEVSGAAEARGVARGMPLGEAFARCPDLALLPGDPVAVAEAWETALCALESIGASVEPARAGLAYFEAGGLRGLHGTEGAAITAARRAVRSAVHSAGGALVGGGRSARLGAGPTRFCALAAAHGMRSRRPLVLEGREARRWLAGRPVALLGFREETEPLREPLGRLGVRTLGELAKLSRPALADRFGEAGVLAHRLACGDDEPLRPRRLEELLHEAVDVGDASSGAALGRVLEVLVDRLLARPERRGRSLRAVTLSVRLLSGGGWRERAVFRQALLDPERIRLALSLRLSRLPAPAATLGLTVERFGPEAGGQEALLDDGRAARRAQLREAIAQMRLAGGQDAALRAVCVDPDSRVPERRVALAPLPE
jgi:nucleotidyltransferase/DNA polymerase involved in DNA repair